MPNSSAHIPNGRNKFITVQFQSELKEYLQDLKNKYHYDKLANAAKNCIIVAYRLHKEDPAKFFKLLNNSN